METSSVATVHLPSPERATAAEKLRESANEVVGSIFYGTLLKQMRDSQLKGPYGHGGRGEEMFQAQLHGILARRAGASRGTTLTDAIVKRYQRQADVIAENDRRQSETLKDLNAQLANRDRFEAEAKP